MGLLEDSAKWLDGVRESSLSVSVVYRRRNGDTLALPATLGRTLFRAENEYGATVRTESRDFLISASRLAAEPRRGDRIVCGGKEYEVLAPDSEPVWRWSGTGHITRRIHTKEIGDA